MSELALNLLKNKIPVTPPILAKLRPYKKVLRDLGSRHSVKKRRAFVSNKKDAGYFKGFTTCYVNVLDRPVNTPHVGASVTRRQSRNREMDNCHYWQHKYHQLYQEYMHILNSTLCENCRALEDGEVCPTCHQQPGWTKCTWFPKRIWNNVFNITKANSPKMPCWTKPPR